MRFWLCFSCVLLSVLVFDFFFFKRRTEYERRMSDWSSDACSSDLMISGTLRHRGMLFAAASVVAMGLAASPASAQSETAADEGTESEIVVTGFRASLENALNAKRSEEHTSELQSLMRISYAVFCLKKKKNE